MLSSVEADSPKAYVHSGLGDGVVDTAPKWPTTISVNSDWTQNRDQTIEFWFRQPRTSTSTYCVLSVGLNNSNKLLLSVQRSNHATLPGRVALTLTGSGGYNLTYSTTGRYDDGEWHHCVIVMLQISSALNQFFYIDGQLESQNYKDTPFGFGYNWGKTTIGDCARFSAGYVISGSPIDEIALYDYELTNDRIAAHYNEVMHVPVALPVSISGLVNISGALKTNKLVRLNTAQFDVDGFIRALILKDSIPFSISSHVNMSGSLKVAFSGRPVSATVKIQSSDLDIIVQRGIGIRL